MNPNAEWLAADGLGGFAGGTVAGIRTRRYHALLLAATTPPTGRYVLVNGFDATVETPAGSFALSSHRYSTNVIHPDGHTRIAEFRYAPNPRWIYQLEDGTRIEHEIVAGRESPAVRLSWRLVEARPGVNLTVRLFLSGRDHHALHRENPSFRFRPWIAGKELIWRPYDGVPEICVRSNGEYRHTPEWYRNFSYSADAARGMDSSEDLAAPGVWTFHLSAGPAAIKLSTQRNAPEPDAPVAETAPNPFLVRRGAGHTIVAGYPWFTDWGRDTFISLRGLCPERARDILTAWCGSVSEGMLPNRFPDGDALPEYNSVDASLWYVIVAHELVAEKDRGPITAAVKAILDGYTRGTRYGIHCDQDGLLAAGVPGVQLTWMDAKVGGWVVTPRIGKPVEIQALWLNALKLAGREKAFQRGLASFRERFWDESRGYLLDVVDPPPEAAAEAAQFRPNQIFACGGLPIALMEGEAARRIVDAVEARLVTPLGLRTLDPGDPAYSPRYRGGATERDAAYHQGTVWPWLMGAFVDAWLRVYGDKPGAKAEARRRFLAPMESHLEEYGLGHLPEIADGDPPHMPCGCPFQAWSTGELMRIRRMLNEDDRS